MIRNLNLIDITCVNETCNIDLINYSFRLSTYNMTIAKIQTRI